MSGAPLRPQIFAGPQQNPQKFSTTSTGVPFYQTNFGSAAPTTSSRYMAAPYEPAGSPGFENEPPLLEELGINPDQIWKKTLYILNPFRAIDPKVMEDSDMAGPLLFCLLLGFFLLLTGKVHFGYIYGLGAFGCVAIYTIVNLMTPLPVDLYRVTSALGYCLLPIDLLAFVSLIVPTRSVVGFLLSAGCIVWCAWVASFMFTAMCAMKEQRFLVAYPILLFYICFGLLTVF